MLPRGAPVSGARLAISRTGSDVLAGELGEAARTSCNAEKLSDVSMAMC